MALQPIGQTWRRFKTWLLAQIVGPYPDLDGDQTEKAAAVVPFGRRPDTGEPDPARDSSPER